MKHCGTQRLETERLVLRRFTAEDAEAMYRNWARDGEVTKFLTWKPHADAGVTRALLENWAASYADERYYQWAITLKELGDEPVGSISAVGLDDAVSSVEIGYCLGRAWWRRGLMTEALGAVLAFFFDEVGANRAEAKHDPRNPNSGRVMRKCGMRYEGTSRSAGRNNQGICDLCRYAVLRADRDA